LKISFYSNLHILRIVGWKYIIYWQVVRAGKQIAQIQSSIERFISYNSGRTKVDYHISLIRLSRINSRIGNKLNSVKIIPGINAIEKNLVCARQNEKELDSR